MPARIDRGATKTAAMTRRLGNQEVPGGDEPLMAFLLRVGAHGHAEELLLGLIHPPKAGQQLVEEEALLDAVVSRFINISSYEPLLLFRRERQIQHHIRQII